MGLSCLIKTAFSCHLACGTGFIIYLIIFFYSGGISSNYNNNGISIAVCIICIPIKPTSCRQGLGRGLFLGGLWLAEGTSRAGQHLTAPCATSWLGPDCSRAGKACRSHQSFHQRAFLPLPASSRAWWTLQDFCWFHLFLFYKHCKKANTSPGRWLFASPRSQIFIGLLSLQPLNALWVLGDLSSYLPCLRRELCAGTQN